MLLFILIFVAAIDGKILDEKTAGQLSTLFDVGGVVGGILAGHISDRTNARAITAAGFMYCAIPALFLYRTYGSVSLTLNITLMLIAGMLINGPYALITTAVSADLGTHSSLKGNGRALATVTAIIDGTGSLGAAIGPLLTGFLSGQGWGAVFIMLMMAALFAGLLLTKLVVAEVVEKLVKYQRLQNLSVSAREELTGKFSSPFPLDQFVRFCDVKSEDSGFEHPCLHTHQSNSRLFIPRLCD